MATRKWNTEQRLVSSLVAMLPLPVNITALEAFTGQRSGFHRDLVPRPPLEKNTQDERIRVLSLFYEVRSHDLETVEVWGTYIVEHKTLVES